MPTAIDLPTRHLEALRALLNAHVPEAEVWAFGSRVRGGAHAGSDLDLVLRNPGDLNAPIAARGRLIEALQESAIPILVEVHDWAILPEDFREEILAHYTPLPIHTNS